MPATLLISLKLILFAMEMEDKKKPHCYKIAKAIQLIFLRKKPLISCTVINQIGSDINFKEKQQFQKLIIKRAKLHKICTISILIYKNKECITSINSTVVSNEDNIKDSTHIHNYFSMLYIQQMVAKIFEVYNLTLLRRKYKLGTIIFKPT